MTALIRRNYGRHIGKFTVHRYEGDHFSLCDLLCLCRNYTTIVYRSSIGSLGRQAFKSNRKAAIYGHFNDCKRHISRNPRHNHASDELENTEKLVTFLNTFLTGQIKSEEENQTKSLTDIQSILLKMSDSEATTSNYQLYTLIAVCAFVLFSVIVICYQIKLLRDEK
ncbi:unnamed protein product [Allacma fusca]|uniref:Uncharacterized protein n=1 Tax=Allacma fusca TaxID=39272 RepID=A0A8J2LD81_9HEXA|nr:unnamed protein product [Allacma fusca]